MEANLTPPESNPEQTPESEVWKISKSNGKEYISRGDGSNAPIWRQGEETPEQARARYETSKATPKKTGKDKRPRQKVKTAPKAEAPTKLDLRELEHQLADALSTPGMMAALYGDDYLTDHFTKSGPVLARNLVAAAEVNPWLRRKLEAFASGDTAMMQVMTLLPVVSATIFYVAPPIIYLLNPPVPTTVRDRFGIPYRKPEYATPTPIFPQDPGSPQGSPPGPTPSQPDPQ